MTRATSASTAGSAPTTRVRGFRTRVLLTTMALVTAVTLVALYVADRDLATATERDLQQSFEIDLQALHNAKAIRHAALVERCRALVRKPRIHAALEDNALDLLYLSAADELRDIMAPAPDTSGPTLRARFYRFLGPDGKVIVPSPDIRAGVLAPDVERALSLGHLPDNQEVGYVVTAEGLTEAIATPILSTETGEPIAALVLGFQPLALGNDGGMRNGVLVAGALHVPGLASEDASRVGATLRQAVAGADRGRLRVPLTDGPHLAFFERLNAHSGYPAAYEVALFPLDRYAARRTQRRVQILGAGALLLVGAFLASRIVASRLSRPVEKLALDSERSARFSADASHQLKTPVAVLRAGLEELLTRDNLTPDECAAISDLIHQTYRLSSLIEDLLLLSRMDSGRLRLALRPIDLAHLIAAALDDLSAAPDDLNLTIETELPGTLYVAGESGYTAIILQNLFENARKYNRPGGRIRVAARTDGDTVLLSVGNTGRTISPAAQAHIFERFHRGAMGENIPGYGLGLNLAHELAHLHEGGLRLVRSGDDWTEFEVQFRAARAEEAV